MAKNTKKKVARIKTKKKTWFKVLSPQMFGKKAVGESYLASAEKALGRVFEVNLRDLTGSMKDQNNYARFTISNFTGSMLETNTVGFRVAPSYIKRLVRKNTARLDDFYLLKTKDGKDVVIKTITVTRNRVQRSTRTDIRKRLGEELKEELGKGSFEQFIQAVAAKKFQFAVKKKLHKIAPVKEVVVRVVVLKSAATPSEMKAEAPAEEEKEVVESVEVTEEPAQEEEKPAEQEPAQETSDAEESA